MSNTTSSCSYLALTCLTSYTPHDFSKPDKESDFSVAITDHFSLDSTILNTGGRDGALFLDSTHRLHNENRAATTVLCTADSDKHMMPGTISDKLWACN